MAQLISLPVKLSKASPLKMRRNGSCESPIYIYQTIDFLLQVEFHYKIEMWLRGDSRIMMLSPE